MKSPADTKIFAAELDIDAPAFIGRDTSESSLLAYILLGKEIIYHPAYGFQKPESGKLILDNGSGLIKPPLVKLVLGDSKSVEEYMPERKAKLKAAASLDKIQIRELEQYNRFSEKEIKETCVALDNKFTSNGGIFPIGWSRDTKFRQLIRQELVRSPQYWSGLSSLIKVLAPASVVQKVKNEIITLTWDKSKLVSCDTVMAILLNNGFNPNKLLEVNHRLRLLHWMTMESEGVQVPLLSRYYRNKIDSYDPEVFWQTTQLLIGKDNVESLLNLPWQDKLSGCFELKDDYTWKKMLKTYHDIVTVSTEEVSALNVEAVRDAMLKAYPTKIRYILDKLNRIELTMFAVSISATTLSWLLYPLNIIKPIALVSSVYTVKKVVSRWIEASKEYTVSDREDLRYRIRSLLRKFCKK